MGDSRSQHDLKPYAKSFEDELDWKLLDQLHGVVSQISNFCFETKKFCVTIQFVVLTFFAKFTHDKLDQSFFVVGLFIPLCFWFLDSVAYFYQVKIRGTMESIQTRLKERNQQLPKLIGSESVISKDRTDKKWYLKVIDSAMNHSMWIYGFMIVADIVAWILFMRGMIP